jgi:hypothetical protein
MLDFTKKNPILLFKKIKNEGIKIEAKKKWDYLKKNRVSTLFCLIFP